MAEFGDIASEFKNAKPPEKVLIIGGVVGVVVIAWYMHNHAAQSGGATGQGGPSTPQSGFPTTGPNQTPILPSGYSPIFDPNGNLVGYGPTSGSGSPSGGTPPPGGGSGGLQGGNPPVGGQAPAGNTSPLIPSGQYNGPSFSNLKWGTTYNYGGTTYQLGTGAGGRLYGVPVNGSQTLSQQQWNTTPIAQGGKTLLYGPPSSYAPKQGGGPFGTAVASQHGKKTSPSKEGRSTLPKVYGRRRV